MFSYTLHRKLNLQLKIENDEPHKNTGGGLSVRAPLVPPVVFS